MDKIGLKSLKVTSIYTDEFSQQMSNIMQERDHRQGEGGHPGSQIISTQTGFLIILLLSLTKNWIL